MRAFTHMVGAWDPTSLTYVFNHRVADCEETLRFVLPSDVPNTADVWYKVCATHVASSGHATQC